MRHLVLLLSLTTLATGQEPDERRRALEAIGESSFAGHSDALERVLAPAVLLSASRVDVDGLAPGASRFAGPADVPAGFEWPEFDGTPLLLLAQIRLADVAPVDELPREGWLLFFLVESAPWGFDPADRGAARVIHVRGDEAALVRTVAPASGLHPCRIEFRDALDLPDRWDDRIAELGIDFDGTVLELSYEMLVSRIRGRRPRDTRDHHLLGYPQQIQGDMRLECQLVTNGLYCGDESGYRDPRAAALREGARDWRLLLQLDHDEDGPGWEWGDCGRVYYWIRQQDLEAGNFDSIWAIIQCY